MEMADVDAKKKLPGTCFCGSRQETRYSNIENISKLSDNEEY